ncbi:MAG: hypothetical protein EXS46_01770 [Candidatus Taylorbacteria bacterium]|nr:hypothetical protein [Candidatus Taylorbacteria bacterium]
MNISSGARIIATTLLIFIVGFLAVPFFVVNAASGLVPCGDKAYNLTDNLPPTDKNGKLSMKPGENVGDVSNPCGWNDFIVGITNVTNYFIIMGTAVSALAFGYAGYLMMTAGGEMSKIQEARSIFGKVLVGFLIMLSAWLIVHAIDAMFISNDFIRSDTTGIKPI